MNDGDRLAALVIFAVLTWLSVGALALADMNKRDLTDCRAKLAAVEQKNGGK